MSAQPPDSDGRPPAADDRDGPTVRGVALADLGRPLGYAIALAAVALFCSVATLAFLLVTADGTTPSGATELDASSSLLVAVVAYGFLASFAALGGATVAYGLWSAWMSRRLRARESPERPSLYRHPVRVLAVVTSDSDDLDAYERRVQRAGAGVVIGGFLLVLLCDLLGVLDLPA
ncbi:hypothetical protein J2752_002542 [Halarchaeum rubridurum]|uniref:Uncharacterized protein n=1 Tax=Halarchaeum rubridurum TaxID=489911 RepID=A0A8T4GRZ5_9EURY|nr:hypothetical protein [Halarchaeum rubridurum]MBP1955619.1 hypothetical protein [Halarchaeum rubridurum]